MPEYEELQIMKWLVPSRHTQLPLWDLWELYGILPCFHHTPQLLTVSRILAKLQVTPLKRAAQTVCSLQTSSLKQSLSSRHHNSYKTKFVLPFPFYYVGLFVNEALTWKEHMNHVMDIEPVFRKHQGARLRKHVPANTLGNWHMHPSIEILRTS
jgi:hypothetical protein